MKIDYKFVDTVSIKDIASALKIEKSGANHFCPNKSAHNNGDKTPSLNIDYEKGVFNCFACGAKGKRLDLIMLALGGDREQAFAWLKENFGDTCAKSTPDKWQMRYLSNSSGRRFGHHVPNGLREPEQHDIENIASNIKKKYTIEGLLLAGAKINTKPYAIAMPKQNFFKYINKESDKAIVVEGMTDFITTLSLGLGNNYNVLARKALKQGIDLPEHVKKILYIVDPENLDADGNLIKLLEYIHGRTDGISEKYLSFGFAELASFESKDISDFAFEYNKETLFNVINNYSRDVDTASAPSVALLFLERQPTNRWLRFIRGIRTKGLCPLQRAVGYRMAFGSAK